MAITRSGGGGPLTRAARAVLLALPDGVTRLRRNPPPEGPALVALVVVALASAGATHALGADVVPPSFQVVPLLGGGLLLRRVASRVLLLVVAACVGSQLLLLGLLVVRPGALLAIVATAVVAYEFTRSREETGLAGSSGDTFVIELRERLVRQGRLPVLPPDWNGEAVLSPAGGGPFAGDFVVSALTCGGRQLELALVDVSGKGLPAGTRALLLSGALGGLLGAVPPEQFLAAANSYLDRQEWDEGFATAVHLQLDLTDGTFVVRSAGHPPIAVYDAGTGRWSVVDGGGGPALGLLPEVEHEPVTGRLDRGDAVLLYTDGLVEVSGRDLSVGIDKLLGEAERLVPQGFAGGGARLVARVGAGAHDDRGLVLLWRSP